MNAESGRVCSLFLRMTRLSAGRISRGPYSCPPCDGYRHYRADRLKFGVRIPCQGCHIAMSLTISNLIKRPALPLILIVSAAVALRLAYILFFGHTLTLGASGYDTYATNLIEGHGYTRFADLHPDSDVPPLYSFFL